MFAPARRQSVFSLVEHALLRLIERIHALLDRCAIPVKRDPLYTNGAVIPSAASAACTAGRARTLPAC